MSNTTHEIINIYNRQTQYNNSKLNSLAQEYLNALNQGINKVWIKCEEHGETWHSSFMLQGQHICQCLKCSREKIQEHIENNIRKRMIEPLQKANLLGVIPFYALTNYSQTRLQKAVMEYLEEYSQKFDESLFICGNKDTGKTLFGKAIGLNAVLLGKKVIRLDEKAWEKYATNMAYYNIVHSHDLIIFDEVNRESDFELVAKTIKELHERQIKFIIISELCMDELLFERLPNHLDFDFILSLYHQCGFIECQWQSYKEWKREKELVGH